jgi:flagellin
MGERPNDGPVNINFTGAQNMALTLNTNIDSLTAQNNLTGSQALLSQSLTRLSSGLRINSAADDAAGLAISQQFTTQVNGTNQAINNANDAVSEAQTAGGALTTIVNNLQSIRTLAVEAANGSNSASDRQALDAQVQQQISEVTQIAAQTQFNGASVLNGSSGTSTYQVGANVGNTISINLAQGVQANQVGQVATSTQTVTSAALAGTLTIAVGTAASVTIGASANYATTSPGQASSSAYAKAAAINAGDISGLTASATTSVTDGTTTAVVAGTGAAGTYALSINGTSIYSGANNVAAGSTLTAATIAKQINLYSTQDGNVTASVGTTGNITLTAADGSNIAVTQSDTAATGGLSTIGTTAGVTNYGSVTLSSDSNITIGGGSADIAAIGQTAGNISLGTSTLSQQNVLTVSGANATIAAVDSALATVSAFQSQLGAIQNRFRAAVSNLTSTSQNLTQSRSTIQDANFAQETANLTQAQVLEQAGISVLSQANQEPQLILKLLG